MAANTAKKASKQAERDYFEQARMWDSDVVAKTKRSERRAWLVAGSSVFAAICMAFSIAAMMPLKTVEPFVLLHDSTTGMTEIITVMKEESVPAQDALNRHWLSRYIRHREGWLWNTREYDRAMVGLMSAPGEQNVYREQTDPRTNSNAPLAIYGQHAEVHAEVTGVSMLNTGERVDGEMQYTALVRFTTTTRRAGSVPTVVHWAATITFAYRNAPMLASDRLENPLGFQVISYRKDQESVGGR